MRTWSLLSGVGVAIVAAWLAVTNLAYGSTEFTCKIPWSGDTDCGLPKITIPARGLLVIEVYTIQKDGEDIGEPAEFKIFDANKDVKVHSLYVGARSTGSWLYESNEAALVAQLRVNHPKVNEVVVRGRYTIK